MFGLATGCLGSHVHAPAGTLVKMPLHLTFEEAATLPTVFITADAVLRQAAGLTCDDRLMVHAAAGGVGLAAMQLAGRAGAELLATAGSPSKRALLRSLGVRHVLSSRDLTFADSAAQLGGVSVLLNALTSPGMVGGSLSALGCGGRLVEIGKRDVWAPAAVAADRPDVMYSLVAVDFMSEAVLHAAMTRLSRQAASGEAAPLPAVAHNMRHVVAALRQMSQVSSV